MWREGIGSGSYGHTVAVPDTITCIDCGGMCHRITYTPHEGFAAGDIVAFRCEQCLDRWDVEITGDDLDPGVAGGDPPG